MTLSFSEIQFTPECRSIVDAWQAGSLSYRNAIDSLTICSGDAAAKGLPIEEGCAELALGSLFHFRGDLSVSFRHLRRARSLYSLALDHNGMACAELIQARNYAYTGYIRMATTVFHSAYEIAGLTGNDLLMAEAAIYEGKTFLQATKPSVALTHLNNALALVKALPENTQKANLLAKTYEALCDVYLEHGSPETAWVETLKGWSLAKENDSHVVQGYANRAVGRVIMTLNASPYPPEFNDDATQYLEAAVKAFQLADLEPEVAHTNYLLARYFAATGRRSVALQLMQKTTLLFTRLGMVEDADQAANQLGRLL